MRESHLRSILKGFSWRITATLTLICIVYFVDGNISAALQVGFLEFLIKLFIYYAHERLWIRYLKDAKQTPKISLYKTISWRIVASFTSLLIVTSILDSGSAASIIVTIEFFAKFAIYFLHERLWQYAPLGSVRKLVRPTKNNENEFGNDTP